MLGIDPVAYPAVSSFYFQNSIFADENFCLRVAGRGTQHDRQQRS